MTEKEIIGKMNDFWAQSGKSKAEMSRELGVDAGTFGNILNGNRGVSAGLLSKFRELLALPLGKSDLEHRDMFLLSFYLIGINMVDMGGLTSDNYVNGRIEYRRAKTGKLYSIKVEDEAAAIIEKYRGQKHLLRCFDRYKSYKDYMQHLNKALRRMGPIQTDANGKPQYTDNHLPMMQPIEPQITSYWARYSWATYAAELDIPKDTISEALGHKYGSAITGVYIKFSLDKIDAANRRVIDYLLGK